MPVSPALVSSGAMQFLTHEPIFVSMRRAPCKDLKLWYAGRMLVVHINTPATGSLSVFGLLGDRFPTDSEQASRSRRHPLERGVSSERASGRATKPAESKESTTPAGTYSRQAVVVLFSPEVVVAVREMRTVKIRSNTESVRSAGGHYRAS